MTRTLTLAALTAALLAPNAPAQQTATSGNAGTQGTAVQGTQGTGTRGGVGTQGTGTQGTGTQGIGTQGTGTQGIGTRGSATTLQNTTQGNTGAQDTTARSAVSDPLFVVAAIDGGMSEVMLAELGARKATDPDLKRFSENMIAEHTRMNGQITALATSKRMTLPQTVSPGHQFCAQSLAGLSGEEFDRCYAKAQLVIHMDSVAKFEAESERGQDPDVKGLASQALTHIKEHLATIKPIAMKYEKDNSGQPGSR